jgi:hypothetical protein
MLESIHWRTYEARDREHILALHVQQEFALGQRMDLPDLMKRPVPIVLPMVAERDGEVLGAFYLEAIPEAVFITRDPLVSASALRLAPQIMANMKRCGFRMVRLHVPDVDWIGAESEIIGGIVKRAGFQQELNYDSYLYDLRGGKIPAVSTYGQERPHDSDKVARIG